VFGSNWECVSAYIFQDIQISGETEIKIGQSDAQKMLIRFSLNRCGYSRRSYVFLGYVENKDRPVRIYYLTDRAMAFPSYVLLKCSDLWHL